MSTFEASVTEVQGAQVLKLSGEARLSIESLEQKSLQLMATRPELVVVDLSEITFLSTLAMGSLVKLYRSLKAHGGKAILAAAQPRILGVLQHTKLDTLFGMSDSVENALQGKTTAG